MNEKFWRENWNKIFFGLYLIGQGERKINGGIHMCFSLDTLKSFLQKIKRKLKGENKAF